MNVQENLRQKSLRPVCPRCGAELIFVAIVAAPFVLHTWQCDCAYRGEGDQPADGVIIGLVADIVRAREWDQEALVLELGIEGDEEDERL